MYKAASYSYKPCVAFVMLYVLLMYKKEVAKLCPLDRG